MRVEAEQGSSRGGSLPPPPPPHNKDKDDGAEKSSEEEDDGWNGKRGRHAPKHKEVPNKTPQDGKGAGGSKSAKKNS